MITRLIVVALCGTVSGAGCATKTFVQEQISATESKLAQKVTATEANLDRRAEGQDAKLRETAERAGENREAIGVAAEQLKDVDARVGEVDAVATDARARADQAAAQAEQATAATQEAEARLAYRLAGRNKYRVLDTKAVYFDTGRTDIRKQDAGALEEVAKALAADPNAILELQGYADSQGGDRYNHDLARERVEVVTRYLIQQHNVELRQLHGVAMGKIPLGAGDKATPETMAEARRVDLRVLAPWASWEDRTAVDPASGTESSAPIAASPVLEELAAPPADVQRSDGPQSDVESPARQRLPAPFRNMTPRDLGGE